jgi:hypothetical protein
MGAPGFLAPAGTTSEQADHYALATLRLWLFRPAVSGLALSTAPLEGWITDVERRFPVPAGWADGLRAVLHPGVAVVTDRSRRPGQTQPDPLEPVRAALVAGIHASATPEREDRLFPGDISQFDVDGVCLGYGAAGVLHALSCVGAEPVPAWERWLLDAVARRPPRRSGLWEGAHGIAYALDGLGHPDAADQVLAGVDDSDTAHSDTHSDAIDVSVRGGLAGAALVLLKLAERRDDPRLRGRALALAARLADLDPAAPDTTHTATPGLLDGWSGPALLHLRAYETTGDPRWLNHADRALRADLERCVPVTGGALQARDPRHGRTLPYLGQGSAGVALAADRLAYHAPGSPTASALAGLLDACRAEFVIHPGLARGAAGLLYTLLATTDLTRAENPADPARTAIDRHLATITSHLVPFRDGLGVPGHQLLRLSMDLDTGNAGVLLALHHASVGGDTAHSLPLTPDRSPTPALTH